MALIAEQVLVKRDTSFNTLSVNGYGTRNQVMRFNRFQTSNYHVNIQTVFFHGPISTASDKDFPVILRRTLQKYYITRNIIQIFTRYYIRLSSGSNIHPHTGVWPAANCFTFQLNGDCYRHCYAYNIYSGFSINSKGHASECLKNIEEMFPTYW